MAAKTLIRGGWVLTLGTRTSNRANADVLVENGIVTEVGESLRARDADVVDASDAIVMPGFVDTHRHAWKSLLRNLGTGMTAPRARPSHLELRDRYEPDDVYAATLISLLGAAEAGITTVVDWYDAPPTQNHVEAALRAHADSRLRTVLVSSGEDSPGPGVITARSDELPNTTIAHGSEDLRRSELNRIAETWSRARDQGLRIHAHIWPDTEQGLVSELGGRGLLGPDVTLAHCTQASDEDLDAISSSGARVSLAPSSEMAQGYGWPPMQKLIDRNIRPGLAVDDESVSPGDLFAQMRVANSLQHAHLFDLKLAGKAGIPNLLSTREVIRYGTTDGAGVAGLGDVTGSIEPGMQADLIILRTDRPNIHPINDPIGAVVWGMDTSNVDWVMVGGHFIVRAGALEVDFERLRAMTTAAHDRVTGGVLSSHQTRAAN